MTGRGHHIPIDHLTALAFVARAQEDVSADGADDHRAFAHVAQCDECAAQLARLTLEADQLRETAFAQADGVFDDAMLDAQRTRILDRLAHLGQPARVITFPRQAREVAMPVSPSGRRWVSVAAAAGLIIGLVAGQLLHFMPSTALGSRDELAGMSGMRRFAAPVMLPASTPLPVLTEDELMEEVEAAVAVRRAPSLRAIDGLTPTAADLIALGR
jgi:anti-sigma factor RsiW